MEISGDEIADVVLKEFERWPQKRKPLMRGDGVREWVPLSGIVAEGKNSLTCLAVATGMKCLPQNKIYQAQGIVLHDWHAEILAIRSLNRFLLEECQDLLQSQDQSSNYLRLRSQDELTETHFQPFALKEDINLHMYCSEAPCGDASMELTMASQEDSTPWELPLPSESPVSTPSLLHGRGYFSNLSAVRGKPSRPDAPPTLSKSCSDKLSLKQCTSLLSSTTSLFISPENLYLKSLTVPESQFSETACFRAFSAKGRMAPLQAMRWDGGYQIKHFKVVKTQKEFAYSRRQVLNPGEKLVASNLASSWTPRTSETLIGGTLQGRKQFSIKGASSTSKAGMWRLGLQILAALESRKNIGFESIGKCMKEPTYNDLKNSNILETRRKVKMEARDVLKGWARNEGGEDWKLP